MNILIIGATGDIGRSIHKELETRHVVIAASRNTPSASVNLLDTASIQQLLERNGSIDALVIAAGEPHFGPLERMSPAQFRQGLEGKLLGQIDAALIAQQSLKDQGSITLTSGIIGESVVRYGACASAVNGALEGFVRAAACEMPRGIRINVISPGLVESSVEKIGQYFSGFDPIPNSRVAAAYARSVEGIETGQIYRVR